jgi:hypothetical protein
MAIQHELSWSASRAGTFQSCPRKYYLDYYGSWLGWQQGGDPARRQAWVLKKMTRMPMLAGQIVHEAIEEWFIAKREGRAQPSRPELIDGAVQRLRDDYQVSKQGKWRRRPAKMCHLAEHHYQEERIEEASGAAGTYGTQYKERIVASLEAFLDMPELAPAREADPSTWLACEDMTTFDFQGTRVFAIPDFAYRAEDGSVHIWDWKTGTPRAADEFQLQVYAGYAREKWNADPEQVVGFDAYLPTREIVRVEPGAAGMDAALERIAESIKEMTAVHFNADREDGDPDKFPMIEQGSECSSCNYRELCDRA